MTTGDRAARAADAACATGAACAAGASSDAVPSVAAPAVAIVPISLAALRILPPGLCRAPSMGAAIWHGNLPRFRSMDFYRRPIDANRALGPPEFGRLVPQEGTFRLYAPATPARPAPRPRATACRNAAAPTAGNRREW